MRRCMRAFITVLLLTALSSFIVSAENTMDIESLDLETGEVTVETMQEDPEDAAFPSTSGFEGTLPEPNVIIGDDDRTVVENTTRVPYRYIGKLEVRYTNSSTMTVGTAFLVSESCVLTAAHCVAGDNISSVTFIPGKMGRKILMVR